MEEERSKVIRKQTLVYAIQEQPPDNRYPQGYAELIWNPVEVLELKRFKEAVISYGVHSPFVKQMLNL